MPDKAWKVAERRLAGLFGTVRRALSGGNSKSGGRDDGQHKRLFLESKYRTKQPLWSLWDACLDSCRREPKLRKRRPVIALFERGRHGCLVCVHEDDILLIAAEYLEAAQQYDFANQLRSIAKC